jgi:hypothetical protein
MSFPIGGGAVLQQCICVVSVSVHTVEVRVLVEEIKTL